MSTHNLATSIHQIIDSTCHSHLLSGCLLCFYHGVIDLVVPLDLNKLIGVVCHLRKEFGIILTDSTGLRVVVMYGEITCHLGKPADRLPCRGDDIPTGNDGQTGRIRLLADDTHARPGGDHAN